MKTLNLKHTYFLLFAFFTLNINSGALPENISELVDESAPAVVNITAKKKNFSKAVFWIRWYSR